ncbi:MAG: hypothetical protein FWD69_11305 [Polyangiaceae bacterium]|nr:hypothetical protein [Polyangiaceae bacterium]
MRHIYGIVAFTLVAAGCTGFDLSPYQPQDAQDASIGSGTCVANGVGATSSALNLNAVVEQLDNGTAVPGGCPANGQTNICKSGVCDVNDDVCGYASGGLCDNGSAATVCRSGKCSAGGQCLAAGQCANDNDCQATEWCDAATNACKAKLDNGEDLPGQGTDCTDETGARFCKTGVCDTTDRACGLLDDSQCGNASQCRTADATCADDGTGQMVCTPPPPCKSDEECAATGQYCNLDTGKCANKVANGDAVPGGCPDTGLSNACKTGVCDANDNKCGVADGDTCTANSECRSGVCDSHP